MLGFRVQGSGFRVGFLTSGVGAQRPCQSIEIWRNCRAFAVCLELSKLQSFS